MNTHGVTSKEGNLLLFLEEGIGGVGGGGEVEGAGEDERSRGRDSLGRDGTSLWSRVLTHHPR